MNYELRHFDTPLMRFSAEENTSIPEIEILWIDEENTKLLPLDLELSGESVRKWLKNRSIPKNRAYVNRILSKSGLSLNRPMDIIKVSKGLSLNDCYWVTEEGFSGSFAEYNLYDNRFSRRLALIAFTGYGSAVRSSLASSPEFTTNGMLPKCWRRINGSIYLYKGGTSGASNTGNEPYAEFYASQIAEAMGIDAVKYTLSRWKGALCSVCGLFTSKEYSFMPVGRLVTSGGMEAVRKYYCAFGEKYTDAIDDMLVLDAVILNTDRHFGNFGFLIDNKTNEISLPAPLFDHGNSLLNYAADDDLCSKSDLDLYISTLYPCVYDDFIGTAKAVLSARHREGLRRLLEFRFKRHGRYNLPKDRLETLETLVRERARFLLQ